MSVPFRKEAGSAGERRSVSGLRDSLIIGAAQDWDV